MSNSNQIVLFDKQITEILDFHKGNSASYLFERYRISRIDADSFVAALIARLCLAEIKNQITKGFE